MISDEMINIAANAYFDASMKDMSNLQPDAPYYDTRLTYRISMDAALTAAYPLIRAQVLEEAAKVCEYKYSGHSNIYGTEQAEAYEHAAKVCAQDIRGMKEKV